MINWIQKHLALRSYRRKLRPALVRRYGRGRHYSINQVRVTCELLGLDVRFLCYAYAAFCEPGEFTDYHEALGLSCDRDAMREVLIEGHDDLATDVADSCWHDVEAYDPGDGTDSWD